MADSDVISVLCSGDWIWDPDCKCRVTFNADGTGEMHCGVEFNVFIASQFDWEVHSSAESLLKALPASVEVSITLTKRPFANHAPPITHTALKDAAFRPKVYRLKMEKGAFKVAYRTTYGHHPTFAYRLLWDPSPFPPLQEWNAQAPARAGRYWERSDFYKDEIEEVRP